MNKYELINEKETLGVIVKLIRNGFLKPDIIFHITVYDMFEELDIPKMERYKLIAEKYNISESHIRRIILDLKKLIK